MELILCLFHQRFIDENPETKKMFRWADESKTGSEQKTTSGFIKHAKAIGDALAMCLTDLDGMDKLEKDLKGLGQRHKARKVTAALYGVSNHIFSL